MATYQIVIDVRRNGITHVIKRNGRILKNGAICLTTNFTDASFSTVMISAVLVYILRGYPVNLNTTT